MRTGVGFPSHAQDVAWSAPSGWAAAFPVANLGSMLKPTKVARTTGSGTREIRGILPEARPTQFIALVNHDLPKGATLTVELYSNATPDGSATGRLYASGAIEVWPGVSAPVSGYPSIRPIVLPQVYAARSMRLTFSTSGPMSIGAVEMAGWWEWIGISPGKEIAMESREPDRPLIGGVSSVVPGVLTRQINGQIDYLKVGGKTDAVLDFQRTMDLDRPFVFVTDQDAPESWPRTTLLAVNAQVPPLTGALYKHDRFTFRFAEHWR